jgi:hypothetical protein
VYFWCSLGFVRRIENTFCLLSTCCCSINGRSKRWFKPTSQFVPNLFDWPTLLSLLFASSAPPLHGHMSPLSTPSRRTRNASSGIGSAEEELGAYSHSAAAGSALEQLRPLLSLRKCWWDGAGLIRRAAQKGEHRPPPNATRGRRLRPEVSTQPSSVPLTIQPP